MKSPPSKLITPPSPKNKSLNCLVSVPREEPSLVTGTMFPLAEIWLNSAVLPDTITFFQLATILSP